METSKIDYKNVYYPPGGILLWLIIFLELFTFGMALIAMVYYGNQEPDLFHESRLLLNVSYGTVNTIILLTSGFFMAVTVRHIKQDKLKLAKFYLRITMFFGLLVLIIKSLEYYAKIQAGLDLGYNTFYTFYWLLTLFHVIHVIVGLVILSSTYSSLNKKNNDTLIEDSEASAAFWHMCDLIWLLLFPIIYLVF